MLGGGDDALPGSRERDPPRVGPRDRADPRRAVLQRELRLVHRRRAHRSLDRRSGSDPGSPEELAWTLGQALCLPPHRRARLPRTTAQGASTSSTSRARPSSPQKAKIIDELVADLQLRKRPNNASLTEVRVYNGGVAADPRGAPRVRRSRVADRAPARPCGAATSRGRCRTTSRRSASCSANAAPKASGTDTRIALTRAIALTHGKTWIASGALGTIARGGFMRSFVAVACSLVLAATASADARQALAQVRACQARHAPDARQAPALGPLRDDHDERAAKHRLHHRELHAHPCAPRT